MSLRSRILLFLFIFALLPLLMAVVINLPLVLERVDSFYRQAFLQNLRADFADLDQHLASRKASATLLARLPEPSLLNNDTEQSGLRLELDRARYTEWINRILRDEHDIVNIRFLDREGNEHYSLGRDSQTGSWFGLTEPLPPLSARQETAIRAGQIKEVTFSPLRVHTDAEHPQQTLTLQLLAPVMVEEENTGVVVLTVDISGLVRRDTNTLWVLDDGHYLQLPDQPQKMGTAFDDFSGLAEEFQRRQLLLWESGGRRWIWVPLFVTEDGSPLWVGREVDSDPLRHFRTEIVERVLAIVAGLIVLLLFSARLLAKRAETISSELIGGIRKTLETDEPVRFEWSDMPELRQLSQDLSRLSLRHAEQTRAQLAHTRELEESNRYKSEFLANVSHELRTPLNSILLLSKLLAADKAGLQGEQREQAQVIHKAGKDLKALIDNILDLSKIEARQLDVACEDVSLETLIEDLRNLMKPQFDEKGLDLAVTCTEDAPAVIRSDPDKIRQILLNFVGNALKFTEQGGVQLQVRAAPEPMRVELAVVDSGIGIARNKQAHIFEAFRQADGSTSRRFGGTGLGLTISRQLAHLLGGEVHLHSEPGKGATFSLILPFSCDGEPVNEPEEAMPATVAEEREPLPADLSGQRVLLMLSDIKQQLQLGRWLKQSGAEVLLADDHEEAIETIDEQGSLDVLVYDPELLAEQTCVTIERVRNHNKKPMMLIGLGNSLAPDMHSLCESAAPDHILDKPLELDAFSAILRGK